ncbi:MAG: ethanolamine permease [Propionibacteriaceae bacterium]|jgi:ethanolamine permease|nr:ethanolamine permease [Propionibacteriaceae bacterium]
MSSAQQQPASGGSGESQEYFAERSLKQGAGGWVLLAGLGVAYVLSGDFSGWNGGLDTGGFGGLLIAFVLMGAMYLFMCFGIAEMSAAMPVAGAGYSFARRAMGKFGGYATGVAILIEYAIAPAAICTFMGDYTRSLFKWESSFWLNVGIYLVYWIIFLGIQLIGAGEALRTIFVITAIGMLALFVYLGFVAPNFDASQLLNVAPDAGDPTASAFLPHGIQGTLSSLVCGIWFFLGIEGVPVAAEEAKDPKKDMPRGIIIGMLILLFNGAMVLFLSSGATTRPMDECGGNTGTACIGYEGGVGAPLIVALESSGAPGFVILFLNIAGLAGLIASFFSLIYACSRQLFALSRAGYLPRWLSKTSSRKVPTWCLLVPGGIGFILGAWQQDGGRMMDIAVFGATISYVMMSLSHVLLRRNAPDLDRSYLTPGGAITTGIATVLGVVAVVSVFFYDPWAALFTAIIFVGFMLYFLLYSKEHVIGNAPEEEFELLAREEAELS